MAGEVLSLGALMQFLGNSRPPQSSGLARQFIRPAPHDPHAAAFSRRLKQAQGMADLADEVYGIPGQIEKTPYMLSEDESFDGEQIPGLMDMNITPGTGVYDTSRSPEERYSLMQQRMFNTGNPLWQELAAENAKGMQTSVMQNTGALQRKQLEFMNEMSSYGKAARDAGLQPGTPGFREFVTKMAMKKAYQDPMDTPYTVQQLEKYMYEDGQSIDPNTTPRNVLESGRKVVLRNALGSDASGRASMLEDAYEGLDTIDNLLYGPSGTVNRGVVRDMLVKNVGRMFGELGEVGANFFMSPEGQKVANSFERGIQAITRIETGAAMPPEELVNTRSRFQPMPGEDDETINQKVAAYRYFIEHARDLIDPIAREGREWSPEKSSAINAAIDKAFAKSKNKGQPSDGELPDGMSWDTPK